MCWEYFKKEIPRGVKSYATLLLFCLRLWASSNKNVGRPNSWERLKGMRERCESDSPGHDTWVWHLSLATKSLQNRE